ncbi:YraN family protein [Siphonobacter curvatus]|uniref:YraN family protein n=1 Tax=Siphonobacter curvatus TaxID=2094562 RepID=UPI0021D1BD8C|nr:YraN family protein [Siphonobacter curvatus]
MPTHLQTGQRGEVLAARFLEQKGYEIVARNYRAGRAEVDLMYVANSGWSLWR